MLRAELRIAPGASTIVHRGFMRLLVALGLGALVGAACEAEDCPAPDDQVAVSFFSYGAGLHPDFVVTEVSPTEVRIACPWCMGSYALIAADYISPAPPLTAFTPGQAILAVNNIEADHDQDGLPTHFSVRLVVDDALTGRPLMRYIYDEKPVDIAELGLAPFEFSDVSRCRPLRGHRLGFDVTLADQTVRVHDRSTARLGDYTIWVGESLDERDEGRPFTSIAILYTP